MQIIQYCSEGYVITTYAYSDIAFEPVEVECSDFCRMSKHLDINRIEVFRSGLRT